MVKILKNWEVAKWTLWSALYLGVHQLVLLNIQALWQNDGGSTDLNGIFYGLAYGCAAITTLIPSRFTPETLVRIILFFFFYFFFLLTFTY